MTGAASGIGRAVTARFAAANWHVIALDLDAARLTQAWAEVGKVTPVALDIAQPGAVTSALDQISPDAIRAVANVAGVYPGSTFLGATAEDYRRTFDVNVLGTLLVSQAAVRYLRAAQRASVVNFASTGAYTAGDGARVLYKAAKAAVVSLTRSMAFELAVDGISVNGPAPPGSGRWQAMNRCRLPPARRSWSVAGHSCDEGRASWRSTTRKPDGGSRKLVSH